MARQPKKSNFYLRLQTIILDLLKEHEDEINAAQGSKGNIVMTLPLDGAGKGSFGIPQPETSDLDLNFALNEGSTIAAAIVQGTASLTFARTGTANAWDQNGLLQSVPTGEPRYDHDPADSNSPSGILIEDAATNVILHSDDLEHAFWQPSADPATVTANTATGPYGASTLDSIADNSATVYTILSNVDSPVTITADTTDWCASMVVKKLVGGIHMSTFGLGMVGGSTSNWASFDARTGVIGAVGTAIKDSGVIDLGDYWRIWIVRANDNRTGAYVNILPANSDTNDGSDVVSVTGAIECGCVQLENASYPSSIIGPTTTTAVTRNAETLKTTDVSWYGDGQFGTFYVVADIGFKGAADQYFVEIGEDGTANDVRFRMYRDQSGALVRASYTGSPSTFIDSLADATEHTQTAYCMVVDTNDAEFYLQGNSQGTDATVALTADASINALSIGRDIAGGNCINGHIKRIQYYIQRMPTDEVITLPDGEPPVDPPFPPPENLIWTDFFDNEPNADVGTNVHVGVDPSVFYGIGMSGIVTYPSTGVFRAWNNKTRDDTIASHHTMVGIGFQPAYEGTTSDDRTLITETYRYLVKFEVLFEDLASGAHDPKWSIFFQEKPNASVNPSVVFQRENGGIECKLRADNDVSVLDKIYDYTLDIDLGAEIFDTWIAFEYEIFHDPAPGGNGAFLLRKDGVEIVNLTGIQVGYADQSHGGIFYSFGQYIWFDQTASNEENATQLRNIEIYDITP
jgi:hypothetical protein